MKVIVGLLGIMLLALCGVMTFPARIHFDQRIGGHLKRAADAATLEVAHEELQTALEAAKEEGFTRGYTSVFYETPDEDVGFWYGNLIKAAEEIKSVLAKTDASANDHNLALARLRQVLLDHVQGNEKITFPHGLEVYPYNGLIGAIGVVGILLLLAFFILL